MRTTMRFCAMGLLALGLMWVGLVVSAAPSAEPAAPASDAGPYHIIKKFPLGGTGGWDYVTFDPVDSRLYVTRGDKVAVIEAATGRPVGEIAGLSGVHGVALAHGAGVGFVTNAKDNTAVVFDLKTLKEVERVKTGAKPDGILYDESTKSVLVSNNGGTTATVIKAAAAEGKPREGVTVELAAPPNPAQATVRGMCMSAWRTRARSSSWIWRP